MSDSRDLERFRRELERVRERLLDLTLRNSLLNHRLLKGRGVKLAGVTAHELFERLVAEERHLRLTPIPEPEQERVEAEDGLLPALPAPEAVDALEDELQLRTVHLKKELDRRLLGTSRYARSAIREQGVNVLFLALGHLHWMESESSDRDIAAPLLLVPVELKRAHAGAHFELFYTGEELVVNHPLREKLKRDFGISDFDEIDVPEGSQLDVNAYFDRIQARVDGLAGWYVHRGEAFIDAFSYTKYLMYVDLDPASWPAKKSLSDHDVMWALLMDRFPESDRAIPADALVDEYVKPELTWQVVDADSSQIRAIEEAANDRNLVIQGPPGTGKSQTITNLIAHAVGQQKTVLFVSEKLAALEVVKRNLDRVKLGATCLELHSHNTTRAGVTRELQRTLSLEKYSAAVSEHGSLLGERRKKLNVYASAVNAAIGSSGRSPHDVIGRRTVLDDRLAKVEDIPDFHVEGMEAWSIDEWDIRSRLVEELARWCEASGPPATHPLWGSGLRMTMPDTRTEIAEAADALRDAVDRLRDDGGQLATQLQVESPQSLGEVTILVSTLGALQGAPDLCGIRVDSDVWHQHATEVAEYVQARSQMTGLRDRYGPMLITSAWNADIDPMRRDISRYGHKWWRFMSNRYRSAWRAASDLFRDEVPSDVSKIMRVLDSILIEHELRAKVEQLRWLEAELFSGEQPFGDAQSLEQAASWLSNVHRRIKTGEIHADTIRLAIDDAVVDAGSCEHLTQMAEAVRNRAEDVSRALNLDMNRTFGDAIPLEERSFAEQIDIASQWTEGASELQSLVSLNHLEDNLKSAGLGRLLQEVAPWNEAARYLTTSFERAYCDALIRRAFTDRSILAEFHGDAHEHAIREFRSLDNGVFATNRAMLRRKFLLNRPTPQQLNTQLAHQMKLQRPSWPLRRLFREAGQSIQRIKPVFMMSPLSVAKYLVPGGVEFDVVIFDEASQVRVEDSLGAIARAKRAVVIGDEKQLPPTSFFDSDVDVTGDDDLNIAELESILDVFTTKGVRSEMLRWHYRSEHESLIAVSNAEFYSPPGLYVFPSSTEHGLGLRFHHLPDTVYGSGTNVKEARIIARAVIDFARQNDGLSLGVGAFSQQQAMLIEDEVERLRRENSNLEHFFSEDQREPFFVKNLETIQGDERDVIFVSVGYGRDSDGKVAMRFGPVNQAGGERRLNVLMTRARKRCEIFSNLTAADISSTGARGVDVLKRFLQYAQTGRLGVAEAHGGFDSDFERAVYDDIEKLGYQVQSQIGVAGYFIDLAIVDPKRPGRYLLGIECDGASYHSAKSARDRDRLRQFILEEYRGWTIHRIWSTDWFHDRAKEIRKIRTLVDQIIGSSDTEAGEGRQARDEHDPPSNPDFRDSAEGEELPCNRTTLDSRLSKPLDPDDDPSPQDIEEGPRESNYRDENATGSGVEARDLDGDLRSSERARLDPEPDSGPDTGPASSPSQQRVPPGNRPTRAPVPGSDGDNLLAALLELLRGCPNESMRAVEMCSQLQKRFPKLTRSEVNRVLYAHSETYFVRDNEYRWRFIDTEAPRNPEA